LENESKKINFFIREERREKRKRKREKEREREKERKEERAMQLRANTDLEIFRS